LAKLWWWQKVRTFPAINMSRCNACGRAVARQVGYEGRYFGTLDPVYDRHMTGKDVWIAANEVIRMFGLDAGIQAAIRADHLLVQGDVDGYNAWRCMFAAIREFDANETEEFMRSICIFGFRSLNRTRMLWQ
jgi:hypothetical protein